MNAVFMILYSYDTVNKIPMKKNDDYIHVLAQPANSTRAERQEECWSELLIDACLQTLVFKQCSCIR